MNCVSNISKNSVSTVLFYIFRSNFPLIISTYIHQTQYIIQILQIFFILQLSNALNNLRINIIVTDLSTKKFNLTIICEN